MLIYKHHRTYVQWRKEEKKSADVAAELEGNTAEQSMNGCKKHNAQTTSTMLNLKETLMSY